MNANRFDVVLDISSPDFGEKLRAALDLRKGEQIEIVTPQFERVDGVKPNSGPPLFNFSALSSLSVAQIKALGCGLWSEPDENDNVLWLYPKEWYDAVPEGQIVHFIDGDSAPFEHGTTDDDYRCGCLAFGFLRPADKATGAQS